MRSQRNNGQLNRNEVLATVTACKYEAGAGQALAFGIPLSKHFRISFNYWANDELHTGEYLSKTAVPQGTLFPITYDPDKPHEPEHAPAAVSQFKRTVIVIMLSLVISVAYFTTLRGCL